LDALSEQPGVFRMPDPDQCQGVVRAIAGDRANNMNYCEMNLLTNETASVSPTAAGTEATRLPGAKDNHVGPENCVPASYQQTAESRSEKAMLPPMQEPAGSSLPNEKGSGRGSEVSHQLINSTHATLAYQIDQAGANGIGRVEVWMTRDKGQTWKFLCQDPDCVSPVEIDLPGDGLYGLSLAVGNGPGATATPPAPGEVPDWWVEVKTSKPVAQITGVHPENGVLIITWTATDSCLKPEPIDLYYAARPDGPWLPIARSLRNDGSYRWTMPGNLGNEIYVRLEVTDRAGNVAGCQTPQPVVRDPLRPKAHVIGLAAGDKRITPPHAQ
jgi:hypothetical protein